MSGFAVFRADASPTMGSGHVMRCLTLADALAARGWSCAFAFWPDTASAVPAARLEPYDTRELTCNGAEEPAVLAAVWPKGCTLLVVDHYDRGHEFEARCRPWAARVMAIDDLANRSHACDLLLDQTLGRVEKDYRAYAPNSCRLLLGPGFALLRPQFAARREESLARRARGGPVRRILVSFGAADSRYLTATALRAVGESGLDVEVDVVIARPWSKAEEIRAPAAAIPQAVHFHEDVADMAALMAKADLGIGAAGSTAWERCCLGLPTLAVVMADNQRLIADRLARAGALDALGESGDLDAKQLAAALRRGADDEEGRRRMSATAAEICDGRGARRVVEALAA